MEHLREQKVCEELEDALKSDPYYLYYRRVPGKKHDVRSESVDEGENRNL